MSFNITHFQNNYLNPFGGPFYPNKFEVSIQKPTLIQRAGSPDLERIGSGSKIGSRSDNITPEIIKYSCRTATLPGYKVDTVSASIGSRDVSYPRALGYGEMLSLDFYCTASLAEKDYFDHWAASIINPQSREVKCKKEIASNILIDIYQQDRTPITQLMYLECFPVDIGDIQLVWETSESATILPVAFSYKKFVYDPLKNNTWET